MQNAAMAALAVVKVCSQVYRNVAFCVYRTREAYFLGRNEFISVRLFSTHGVPNMSNSRKSSTLMYGLLGISMGALVGAGYSYHKKTETQSPAILNKNMGTTSAVLETPPDFQISRKVVVPADNTGLKLTLFQYTTCPFCCKVRAVLDYYGFSYNIIEVNPVLRQQIKWTEYKKVPIVLAHVDGVYQQMNDSSMIISALASYLHDRNQGLEEVVKFYPSISFTDDDGKLKNDILNRYFLMYQGNIPQDKTKDTILKERQWRKWADDVLVHMLSPNVYRTREEALQAFNWFSEVGEWEKHFSTWERYLVVYVGAYAMWIIGKRLKKRHNLKDNVRASLYDACNHWMKSMAKQGTEFMGGEMPDLSDLAVYGVLSSIEGCVTFQDLLQHTSIGKWYYSMKQNVQSHAGCSIMNG
ncbi:prostaglandin E synthase 2 [Zootermopsis nevadensis]|uniref:Prostaglandin E synthase 2 n=1 Tax=Zootermopsis nevadensis TaxID=136037 RepID=A0A067RP32_ZOONE|nr:prostaglandin E synthase 2 [Zootermopsis nevadensis]KDR21499.1 Prostaglandin E synthase 2 [Zootermopsis nevadensis]